MKILIVEDEPKTAAYIKKGLTEHDKEDPKVINAEAKDKDKTTV